MRITLGEFQDNFKYEILKPTDCVKTFQCGDEDADKLSVNDFASNSEFNRFRKRRFVHEKRLRSYPAVKLCRLGVDISMKGTGLGSIILSLIEFLCTQGNRIGCRFITVDAYKTATPFYIKNGFQPLSKGTSNCFTEPLFMDLHSML